MLRGIIYLLLVICALPALAAEAKTKVLFVAGNPSHAPGDHEHRAGEGQHLHRAHRSLRVIVRWASNRRPIALQ